MKFAITPEIVIFVGTDQHATRVLPALLGITANRLIVPENVGFEQSNLD